MSTTGRPGTGFVAVMVTMLTDAYASERIGGGCRGYRERMEAFAAADGTRLAVHRVGDGPPLICLPGGPMRASAYLGNLGGLSEHYSLLLLDPRGTGDSDVPADPTSYRCDRLVDDVETLRSHLGLDRMDLLAHSAGAALAVQYAVRHPDRLGRLVLVTPSARAVDLEITDLDRRQVAELRGDEVWFPDAFAAFERIWADSAEDADWDAITPFRYGHWDDVARAEVVSEATQKNVAASEVYYSDGAIDPERTRAALARLQTPALLVAGEYDVVLPPRCAAQYAALFPQSELVIQDRAGHSPWLDDPEKFVETVTAFLG